MSRWEHDKYKNFEGVRELIGDEPCSLVISIKSGGKWIEYKWDNHVGVTKGYYDYFSETGSMAKWDHIEKPEYVDIPLYGEIKGKGFHEKTRVVMAKGGKLEGEEIDRLRVEWGRIVSRFTDFMNKKYRWPKSVYDVDIITVIS